MPPIRLTCAVRALLISCIVLFLIQQTADQFMGGNVIGWLGLIPANFAFGFRFWQIVTYSFLHGDVTHLLLNMPMLVFIGSELEALWGTVRFLRYYFICVVSAGALYLALQIGIWGGTGLNTPMVGASGGIYGLLMAYGLLFGERVLLFMMLFPMKAKHFVWILMAVEFFTSLFSGRGGLSSAAHLGGMVAGFAALWARATIQVAQRRKKAGLSPAGKAKKRSSGGHLKLLIDNERQRGGGDDDADSGPKTWH
jgi:membrane associated rhomboid family serine protease